MVEAPDGSHWFVHFQDRDAFGRVVHLQPMGWGEDGWPWMGEGGQPVLTWPAGAQTPPASSGEPERADAFAGPLNPAWHWQATPREGWAQAADGTLSLAAVGHPTTELRTFPAMLGQSLPGYACTMEISLELDADAPDGTRAGLCVFGHAYALVGLERRAGADRAVLITSAELGTESVDAAVPAGGPVALRVVSDGTGAITLSARGDGFELAEVGFRATEAHWIGSDVCVFAQRPLGTPTAPAPGSATGGSPAPDPHPPTTSTPTPRTSTHPPRTSSYAAEGFDSRRRGLRPGASRASGDGVRASIRDARRATPRSAPASGTRPAGRRPGRA